MIDNSDKPPIRLVFLKPVAPAIPRLKLAGLQPDGLAAPCSPPACEAVDIRDDSKRKTFVGKPAAAPQRPLLNRSKVNNPAARSQFIPKSWASS